MPFFPPFFVVIIYIMLSWADGEFKGGQKKLMAKIIIVMLYITII
jgi:hypothetical protein